MDKKYDIVIAGGGLAGSMACARFHHLYPEKNILLLERENQLGGRLRDTNSTTGTWTYALNSVSTRLVEFINQELSAIPGAQGTEAFSPRHRMKLGVLAANKVSSESLAECFSKVGARAIAGAAAARDWTLMDELASRLEKTDGKSDQIFAAMWKGTRKSPAAIATEHLARLYGMPDIWNMRASDVMEKKSEFLDSQQICDWSALCQEFLKEGLAQEKIDIKLSTEIGDAARKDDEWQVATTSGTFHSKTLVVAQNPWDALRWLQKNFWPTSLVAVPIKTKPISTVLLSEKIEEYTELPDVVLVPAEGVQAYIDDKTLCLQATLNYESTLVAPEVVKAIRRLKRARQKLINATPGLKTSGNHLALVPVAWSQPMTPVERRVMAKLSSPKWQNRSLVFCGDAYGSSIAGDENLITSLSGAAKALEIN